MNKCKNFKNRIEPNSENQSDQFTLLIKSLHGLIVEKEHRFHPIRKWRFDYAILDKMIAIEVEGGVFSQGRHTRGVGFSNDMEKYNNAVVLGWRLLRVTPSNLCSKSTFELIEKML